MIRKIDGVGTVRLYQNTLKNDTSSKKGKKRSDKKENFETIFNEMVRKSPQSK